MGPAGNLVDTTGLEQTIKSGIAIGVQRASKVG
jgi:hypothetical protein